MAQGTKFNVIIPTRERADVLVHCLRTLVAQEYENLNIIVSDNFGQDHTRDVVESFSDPRIHYFNTGRRLSMSHNWEFGLSQVTDGWVMFLGDDDGLYPGALQTLDALIHAHDVEAINSVYGFFQWPGHFPESMRGQLHVPISDTAEVKQSRRALESAFAGNLSYDLPWLYNGSTASLALINRARDQNGQFFCSQIPDVYSAVALASVTHTYLFNQTPIAIAGISMHSTGTALTRSLTDRDEESIAKFKSEPNIPFHPSLVLGKSVQIMLYECYLQSWHLHHGGLGITLENQLQMAIQTSLFERLPTVREECRMIAEKNGIAFVANGAGWKYRFRRLARDLKRECWNLKVDPARLGAITIHDAVIASAYLYRFVRQSHCRQTAFMASNALAWTTQKIRSALTGIWGALKTKF